MHHFESNGVQFNYNGDYSGDIHVINNEGEASSQSFTDLASVALIKDAGGPYVQALRDFVGAAVIHEAISRLEQIDPEKALGIPWLRGILTEMT